MNHAFVEEAVTNKDETPTVEENEQADETAAEVDDAVVDETGQVAPEDDVPTETPTSSVDAKPATAETDNHQTNSEERDEVTALRAEADKNLQGWQRTLAEFQNYKRRVEREQQALAKKSALDIIGKMLPIVDDFERAMDSMPDDLKDVPWLSGITLIRDKFLRLMDEYEVEAIDPKGDVFDPNLHQAIAMDDSDDVESGHVIETLQKGYRCGDTILRSAMVRVAN